jgi:hypothetical protein
MLRFEAYPAPRCEWRGFRVLASTAEKECSNTGQEQDASWDESYPRRAKAAFQYSRLLDRAIVFSLMVEG